MALGQLGTRLAPAASVVDRGVVRKLHLENVHAERAEAPGGLDHGPPTVLAGQLRCVRRRERQRLKEERQVERVAGAGRVGDETLLVGCRRSIRVVVDEQLGRSGAQAPHVGRTPALDEQRAAVGRRSRVAGLLEGDYQAGRARQGAIGDGLCRAELRVEQDARGARRERACDLAFELDQVGGRNGAGIGRPQVAAQVLAMIEGEDGEPTAGCRALRQAAEHAE